MRVFTPEFINAQTMYSVLGQVFDEAGYLRSNKYTFDFEQTRDIDDAGWVMLDTVLLRITSQGCPVLIREGKKLSVHVQLLLKLQSNSLPNGALSEELFKQDDQSKHGNTAFNAQFDVQGRDERKVKMSVKVHRFPVADAGSWLQKVYNNWLAHELYASSLIVAPQTQHFLELLDNVKIHAGVTAVSIATSYNAVKEELRFVLSDAGRGIPATIRGAWKEAISDEVGIAKAIEGGRVSKGEAYRREGGLGRLVQEIVDQRAGSIVVTSGFGRLSCFSNSGGKVHLFEQVNAFFPGTMIETAFSANPIRSVSILNEPSIEARFV